MSHNSKIEWTAGHDRCPISLKPESIDAWLTPSAHNLETADRILDDKVQQYYQHQIPTQTCPPTIEG